MHYPDLPGGRDELLVKRWINQGCPQSLREVLCADLGISPTTANILVNRGIKDKEEADVFLRASLDDLVEPFLMDGMERVVGRVIKAIRSREKILIYGDYDADGITATSLLLLFLKRLGAEVDFYIPGRQEEGYGMSMAALDRISGAGTGLIITVDCGISSVAEVDAARSMGMDVIITDHHEPPEELPRSYATLNPCLKDSSYPFTGLAGVGVAMKLAQGVLAGLDGKDRAGPGIDPSLMEYLDLVAFGTIADVVPLRGENRILVRHGLKLLRDSDRAGILKLKDVAMIKSGRFSAGTVGFQMAPRLNASGRLGRAELGVVLLTTSDAGEAAVIAGQLDELNRRRQKIEGEILDEARAGLLAGGLETSHTIVLCSDRWHQGVIGIVASKLVEEFFRPTVLIAMKNGVGKGSARSIPAFHLYEGLERCGDLLEGFGGHKFAAGLSITEKNLERFKSRFDSIVSRSLVPDDFIPYLRIDDSLDLADLDWKLYGELGELAPFGAGNPEPVLQSSGLEVKYPKIVGRNHVKMKFRQDGCVMGAIGFNMGDIYQSLAMDRVYVDAAFSLEMNEWQGEKTLQLNVKDIHF